MTTTFGSLDALLSHGFDTVIDVRSPAEYAEDHIPGAINLPALDNDERARVGTIYVQEAAFKARRIGAALVARNLAAHLEGPLRDKPGGWRPLVYCWRGGQRSGAVTSWLTQVGWRAERLQGGYQTYRSLVHDALYQQPLPHRLILIDGNTGTAKTDILHRLARHGVQVLDLEGLANHRGSLLGSLPGGQPPQKWFETQIARQLAGFDPARPVLVEAESSKVGARIVPPSLWSAMKAAPRIEVEAPAAARAAYLAQAYHDVLADRAELAQKLAPLRRLRGGRVDHWLKVWDSGDMAAVTALLMEEHYDPTYRSSRAKHAATVLHRFPVAGLSDEDRDGLAGRIATWLDNFNET
ncbi:tRNA 2-selenouridine(34) synthase MnmH [Thalassorhabdomicrobium marinisediminis]|uniref:tRNA 2-selenouridine(34) synthase MnmH n=1 Tax=Thalassorhabdomicrobium marinisediminis TaxID=2170577 RepID=A0A2T7FVQ5_9RHOB|nr:tRNA 2-selenouridine(34) synthase MnmH [Thalassorhabdomicrobium marinisediminis]PVA06238.1 tRNA 2-selenouridine(34) synthase MnmH [Thalassorhabdomicrobium marinisediminis]